MYMYNDISRTSKFTALSFFLFFAPPTDDRDDLLQVAEVQGWLTRANLENGWAGNDIAV